MEHVEAVALGMHYGQDDGPRNAPLAAVDLVELDRMLAMYASRNPGTEGDTAAVLERREELLERSGLLLPRGEGRAEFYHQDFRDFLAAERWVREGRTLRDAIRRFKGSKDWRRMLSFLFAKAVDSTGGVDRPLEALEGIDTSLAPGTLSYQAPAALVLADCLEIAAGKSGVGGRWQDSLRKIFSAATTEIAPAKDRNDLLLALGRLGWDDRRGVGVNEQGIPDIDWLPVHAESGDFFYIARYPVTQIQFQALVEAEHEKAPC